MHAKQSLVGFKMMAKLVREHAPKFASLYNHSVAAADFVAATPSGDGDVCSAQVPIVQRVCRHIVISKPVELFIYFCIVLAAVVSGIQNMSIEFDDETLWVQLIEWGVLVVFSLELLAKLGAETRSKAYHFFWDPWNVFDFSVLSTIVLVEVIGAASGMAAVRLLRLMRAVRVLRTARILPGMAIIIETLVRSFGSVFYIFIVGLMFMYVFAVIGVSTFGKNDPFYFGNLGVAFLSLLRILTFDSWTTIMYITVVGIRASRNCFWGPRK
jgi:voltage-gated sodium channel